MRNTNSRICCVDALSAITGRTVYINLAIVRIYMHFNIFYLRHDRNRCRRCMNTSAGFCRWDSLNAMHTAFIF